MSDMLTERDVQAGVSEAWHRKTTIVEEVTPEVAMPFEVVVSPLYVRLPDLKLERLEGHNILLADDDNLPVGAPFLESYCPNKIGTFWDTLTNGLQGREFKIISAGTVENRSKLFASVQITDGFTIGGKEFKDYITLLDSFDKSMAFTCRYTNVCVVCSNTFAAAMNSGKQVGRAKHTKNFEGNVDRLVNAIDEFAGISAKFNDLLGEASVADITEGNAREWITGVNFPGKKELGNADKQKFARMTELFRVGSGNAGKTRLDAFSALTEWHSHESSNRKDSGSQYISSEFGTSAMVKTRGVQALEEWEETADKGKKTLNATFSDRTVVV